jgi:hypothetical protein
MMSSSKSDSRCLYRNQACKEGTVLAVAECWKCFEALVKGFMVVKPKAAGWERARCVIDARQSSEANDDATKCQRCSPSPLPHHESQVVQDTHVLSHVKHAFERLSIASMTSQCWVIAVYCWFIRLSIQKLAILPFTLYLMVLRGTAANRFVRLSLTH